MPRPKGSKNKKKAVKKAPVIKVAEKGPFDKDKGTVIVRPSSLFLAKDCLVKERGEEPYLKDKKGNRVLDLPKGIRENILKLIIEAVETGYEKGLEKGEEKILEQMALDYCEITQKVLIDKDEAKGLAYL